MVLVKDSRIILYADDDADDLAFMKDAVELMPADNYRLVTAGNGKEAMHVLERLFNANVVPCVIILDVNMPMISGIEVAKQIRHDGRWNDIPICLFSTSPVQLFNHIRNDYQVECFQKPATIIQLQRTLAEMLSKCRISLS